ETFKHYCRLLCLVIVVGCFHVVLKSAPWNAFPSIIDPVDKLVDTSSALNDISCEMCAEVIPEQKYGLRRLVFSMPKMIREGCLPWSSSISLQTCFPNPFRTRKRGYRLPLVSAKTTAVIRSFSLPAHFIQTDLVPDLLHVCFDFVNVKFRHN
ncbi:unnamed protein product, partial [Aphanomyces euteiches]